MRPAGRLVAAVLVALPLAGCSLGSDDELVTSRQLDTPVAVGADASARGPGETRAERAGAGAGDAPIQAVSGPPAHLDPVAVPVALSPIAEVVDEECWGGETRCGTVLVPQVEGSADLVAIGFREWNGDRPGDPLVVVEWPGSGQLTGQDFPDRPVVLVGGRDAWNEGPSLTCRAFDTIALDATLDEVAEVAAQCRAWLTDAGLDLAGASLRARVSDVANVVAALGHESIAVVVAGSDADVAAGLAAVVDVDRTIYVNPFLPGDGVATLRVGRLLAALEEGWEQCRRAPSCQPAGTIDEFFAAVAALDADPLPSPWFDRELIDGIAVREAVLGFADNPRLIGGLPELHRALVDRDADTVNAFLLADLRQASSHQLVEACRHRVPPGADPATVGAPPSLAAHVIGGWEVFATICEGLGVDEVERPAPRLGLVIETRSVNPGAGSAPTGIDRGGLGPVIVEPTVGWPSEACLIGAITAYLAGALDAGSDDADRDAETRATVEVDGCRTGMRFATRDDSIEPVSAVVDDGPDHTVTLTVPGNWVSAWPAHWARQADIDDPASLALFTWPVDDPAGGIGAPARRGHGPGARRGVLGLRPRGRRPLDRDAGRPVVAARTGTGLRR